MPHLWISREPGKWEIMPLVEGALDMTILPPKLVTSSREASFEASSSVLLRSGKGGDVWALIGGRRGPDVRVNGISLTAGIRILADRDEIAVGQNPSVYFSTEKLATIEEFPETELAAFCPRCKQQIAAKHPAVKCPNCGVFYHQSNDLPCWTYAEVCALCPHPTALNAEYQWTPEEL